MARLANSTLETRTTLRRTGWKRKAKTPLKQGLGASRKSVLRKLGKSPVSVQKRKIQALLRQIVMIRDKGCVLAQIRCNRRIEDAGVVWQADHLLSRSNAATFGDSRLVVLVCQPCHAWKSLGSNLRKAEYDRLVRTLLPKERVSLWDMAEIDAGRHKGVKMDWTLVEISLQKELDMLTLPPEVRV